MYVAVGEEITVRPKNSPLRIEYSGGTVKCASAMRILKSQGLINSAQHGLIPYSFAFSKPGTFSV